MLRSLKTAIPLALAAVAAVLSSATIAFTGVDGGRLAAVPMSLLVAVFATGIVALFAALRARGGSALPLALVVLPLAAWLPGTVPPLLLLWSGGMAMLVWVAVLAVAAASARRPGAVLPSSPLAAGVLAAAIYSFAAWQVAPSIPGGDEPHYLVITQSLLGDGDLKIENNHRQRDYRAYFAGDLPPDYRVRGRDGHIYSVHEPGVSALVLPAFALFGYRGVVLFLILVSAAGSALAWHLARRVSGSAQGAWFGWAAVTLSATAIFHSFTVYPDTVAAVIVLTGIWALLRAADEQESGETRVAAWLWHGAALAALPWMHQRFAAIAGCLGALLLLRLGRVRNAPAKAAAFLAVPAVSAVAWIAMFVAIYGKADPAAPFGDEIRSLAFIPGAIAGLLFDQRFGLLAFAPALAFAFGGLAVMLRARTNRRLAVELLFTAVPYLLVVAHVAMWWGGHSAPARFVMPVLLTMTIPAAIAWTSLRARTARVAAVGALVFTAFLSAVLVLVEGGRLAYNTRETYAYWLEWMNGTVDLGRGLPSWWRDREPRFFTEIAVWLVALAVAWGLLRWLERRPWARTRAAFGTCAAATFAGAAMLAVAVTWRLNATAGTLTTPAQLQVLRSAGQEGRLLAVDLQHWRLLRGGAIAPMLRIEPQRALEPGGAGRNDRPLYTLPAIPAGRYRLVPRTTGEAWLMIGIGRDQFSLRSEALAQPPQVLTLDFPVDVRAIVVRGDEQARRHVTGLTVEPLAIVPPSRRLSAGYAHRAVRYAAGTIFFMDDASFPEPEAFWVGGARRATIVLQPDGARPIATLLVRNAPVENRVLIETAGWRDEAQLGPGEEHRVEVPLDAARGATLVRISASAGFRPSEVEPGSRDERFLGVWVRWHP